MQGHVTILGVTPNIEAMIASGGRISTMDGTADEIFETSLAAGVSLGKLAADQDVVGALGARVMSEAILRAVQSADAAYGLPCAKDFQ